MKIPPRVKLAADADGRAIAQVELANRPGVYALIDADDLTALQDAGLSPRWHLNSNRAGGEGYVRFFLPGVANSKLTVARAVMRAGLGEAVRYRNGNRLDLRRRNLYLETARGRAGAWFGDYDTPISDPLPADRL